MGLRLTLIFFLIHEKKIENIAFVNVALVELPNFFQFMK